MAKLFAVTCKQNVQRAGAMLHCPDGFNGIYDADAKEVREVKLEMPVTTTSLGSFDGSMTMPSPRWVPQLPASDATISINDEFLREYMTSPSLAKEDMDVMKRMVEEKVKRAAEEQEKLLRRKIMLGEFGGDGIGKISAGLADMLGKKQIPTDRSSFPPVRPRNKDVPMTTEEDAW